MKLSRSPGNLQKIKKIFTLDFIIFALVALICWIIMLHVIGNTFSSHSHYDEHTRQALAWREGKITLDHNIEYLEIAKYKEKYYVSFPPAPTFMEFPLTFFFGLRTPNTLTLLIFTWVGLLFSLSSVW